jgi:hypothetical protein
MERQITDKGPRAHPRATKDGRRVRLLPNLSAPASSLAHVVSMILAVVADPCIVGDKDGLIRASHAPQSRPRPKGPTPDLK